MKNELRLHVTSLDGFFADAASAAARIDAGDISRQPETIAFETMDLFLETMTSDRWRLLQALKVAGTVSVRSLSQLLERDYREVHSDVRALIEAGLIESNTEDDIFVPWDRVTAEMVLGVAA